MLDAGEFLSHLDASKKNEFKKYLQQYSSILILYKFWNRITILINKSYQNDLQMIKGMKRIYKIYFSCNKYDIVDNQTKFDFTNCINDLVPIREKINKVLGECKIQAEKGLTPSIQNFQGVYSIELRDRRITENSFFDEGKNSRYPDENNISNLLIEKLLTKNFNVLSLFIELATLEGTDSGMESQVLYFLEKNKILSKFYEWAFEERIKKTLSENEMLREDGVDTKILRVIDYTYANSFIKKVLEKPIKKVLKDPKSYILTLKDENGKKNTTNLCKICDEILLSIENRIEEMPKILVDLCLLIKEKSIQKFGGDGTNSLISLFFLRIIQKRILLPESFKLIQKDKITIEERSALSSVSKTLKNIVCGITQEEEKKRNSIDDLVVSSQDRIKEILNSICKQNTLSQKIKRLRVVVHSEFNLPSSSHYFDGLADSFQSLLPKIKSFIDKWTIVSEKENALESLDNILKTSIMSKRKSSNIIPKRDFMTPQLERRRCSTVASRKKSSTSHDKSNY
eukprot:TRINITY_DN8625_c0_g1_i2.p1 TRINITY_DN8625_c0_g1~~TRINITY_DN8625_c0_g1_i2.p1  ORF type:complete len:513 (+),score=128.64 TRINITY_DN8625_c0_g1_i2:43-1581(+)